MLAGVHDVHTHLPTDTQTAGRTASEAGRILSSKMHLAANLCRSFSLNTSMERHFANTTQCSEESSRESSW